MIFAVFRVCLSSSRQCHRGRSHFKLVFIKLGALFFCRPEWLNCMQFFALVRNWRVWIFIWWSDELSFRSCFGLRWRLIRRALLMKHEQWLHLVSHRLVLGIRTENVAWPWSTLTRLLIRAMKNLLLRFFFCCFCFPRFQRERHSVSERWECNRRLKTKMRNRVEHDWHWKQVTQLGSMTFSLNNVNASIGAVGISNQLRNMLGANELREPNERSV